MTVVLHPGSRRYTFAKPSRVLLTAGMPRANGRIHLGQMAGAHVPADIAARYWQQVIGKKNVLYVCGSDDHGSAAEMAAHEDRTPVREFVTRINDQQRATFSRYNVSFSGGYAGTSHPDYFDTHQTLCQDFFTRFHENKLLVRRRGPRLYDPVNGRFLMDRQVRGGCPDPKCDNQQAYGDECGKCGSQHEPEDLSNPVSAFDKKTKPIPRDTTHWHLDISAMAEPIQTWLQDRKRVWRPVGFSEVLETIAPSLRITESARASYETVKRRLPVHGFRDARDKKVILRFNTKADLAIGQAILAPLGIISELNNEALVRSITRDESWGIPLPLVDPEMADKSLYARPASLLAPIGFSMVALQKAGRRAEDYREFWCEPKAKIIQMIGQDDTYFYSIMQAAMWLGSRMNFLDLPQAGDFQLPDVMVNHHLLLDGEKMSTSTGKYYTADQFLDEFEYFPRQKYTSDQVRYASMHIGLAERSASFSFDSQGTNPKDHGMNAHCDMLGGRINNAIEKPISAVHSETGGFNHKVPQGKLIDEVESATLTMIDSYHKKMQRQNYAALLVELEVYAKLVNSLFTKYKPHVQGAESGKRADALYSAFYILKNLMIMLQPFTPETMERVRQSLNLPETVFSMEELGKPMDAGHPIGAQMKYFPSRSRGEAAE